MDPEKQRPPAPRREGNAGFALPRTPPTLHPPPQKRALQSASFKPKQQRAKKALPGVDWLGATTPAHSAAAPGLGKQGLQK